MKQKIIEQLESMFTNAKERLSSNFDEIVKDMKFLLAAQDVKEFIIEGGLFSRPIFPSGKPGSLVSVRPVGEEHEGKTYIGFLVGDMATGLSMKIEGDKMVVKPSGSNPCIFVPALGATVMGYESWWAEIKNEEDFKNITDDDIENTWYVKMWKQMNQKTETSAQE